MGDIKKGKAFRSGFIRKVSFARLMYIYRKGAGTELYEKIGLQQPFTP